MSNLHALLVDDNLKNLKVLDLLLKQNGLTSTAISDSSQVERILDGLATVDVVLLDLEMPKFDGYAVKQVIRSHDKFADVPIVACSIHTNEMRTVSVSGFNGFIGKPIDAARFPEHLQRILNGEAVWEAI